ncbi:Diaminobutyrate--2-oxoglutarate transaminase [compost metagenome]
MSVLLIKSELDIWKPGEHNGTFRGNQLAFVTAKAALEFRIQERLGDQVREKEEFIKQYLKMEIEPLHPAIIIRGIGLVWGIDVSYLGEETAKAITKKCFESGLIVERVGRHDTVIKIMPPLTISINNLKAGCDIIKESLSQVCLTAAK